jgi:hypothetical protein
MRKPDLSERVGFPQEVQRKSSKGLIDGLHTIKLIISVSYGVSKGNRNVLGDSFNLQNVSCVPWLRWLNCCLMVQVRAKQTEWTGQRI